MKHQFFAPFRKPITYIILLVIFGGIFTYINFPKGLYPRITFPKIKIIADNGEQPVNKMTNTVTRPLEIAIKRASGVQMVRSRTSRGSSELSAFLSWNSDVIQTQQLIQSQISQIRDQLPPNTSITVQRMNFSSIPVIGFILRGKDKNLTELTQTARYTIRPFLSQIEGVSYVQIQGKKPKQYWATLKPEAMSRLGVTPSQIKSAISKSGFIQSNGFATGYRRLYLTLTDAAAYSLKDMRKMVISNNGTRPIRLGDVAALSVHPQIRYVKVGVNGHEGILVNIFKHPDQNLVNLSAQVDQKMSKLRSLLPRGVTLNRYYDQSVFVGGTIHGAIQAIWIGLLCAIVVIILFLRSFRSSVTMLCTIPVTIALTLLVLYAVGYTLNLMTLGAIAAAIALIIDDAIIVIEQIHRVWEEHPDESSVFHIQKGITYLFPALVGSSLSTIVIFLPFSLMGGVAGAFFKVLAYTMVITLVCSFFVVWLALPVIYILVARPGKAKMQQPQKTEPARWSKFLSSRPYIAGIFVLVIVVLAGLALPRLPSGFLPEMDTGTIVLDYRSPPGSSLQETNQLLSQVDDILKHNPAVANYSRRTGAENGFFITEPNSGDFIIRLKTGRSQSTSQVISELRSNINARIPGLGQVEFGQLLNDEIGDLTKSVEPVNVKIFGSDPQVLKKYARNVAGLIRNVPGTADVFDGITIAGPSFTIVPDASKLAYYHMSPADLRLQLQTHLQGIYLAGIPEQQQVTPLQMIYPPNLRNNISSINKTNIMLPGGKRKPLSTLAKVRINQGSAEIDRENLQNMLAVTARLENRDLGSTVQAIKKKIGQQISLPQGYRIDYGGAYAQQQKSFGQLLTILLISSLLVFTISLFLFRSVGAAINVFLTAVLGLTGSVFALYLTGTPLDVSSYTGIIMIVGIIAENAIFTYYQFQQAHEEGMELKDAIAYAISLRLRPKLMTVTAAIAALLPLALATGFHKPLAIAVIGGFIIALPLLLVVLPAFIQLFYRFSGD